MQFAIAHMGLSINRMYRPRMGCRGMRPTTLVAPARPVDVL